MASARIINFCYSPSVVRNKKEINLEPDTSLRAEWFGTDVKCTEGLNIHEKNWIKFSVFKAFFFHEYPQKLSDMALDMLKSF